VNRFVLASLALVSGLWAQSASNAPLYSAESVANAATSTAGPFAPNVIVSIYGTNLSWTEEAATPERMKGGGLPYELANVRVLIGNGDGGRNAPLYFVSPRQINFLIPPDLIGTQSITVVRQGTRGPKVDIQLQNEAPEFFLRDGQTVLAMNNNFDLLSPEAPAKGGDWIVLYAAGLGQTDPPQIEGRPWAGTATLRRKDFRLLLNGNAIDRSRVAYAGAAPGFVGVYQINVHLPDDLPADPEIRLGFGDHLSATGIKLPVRPQ